MKQKRKSGRKLLSFLITLALVVGLMPGMGLTAYAEGDYSSLKNTTIVVNFDGKKWYLIDYDDSTVTLLSKECVDVSAFGSGSTVETTVNKYYTDNFSADAKVAVNGSGMFLLTKDQANAMTTEQRKCPQASGTSFDAWWLFSSGVNVKDAACVDGATGQVRVYGGNLEPTLGVRPALQLNLESVIFSSETNTFSPKPVSKDPVSYMAWDETEKKLVEKTGDDACKEYEVVTADTTTWGATGQTTWYVVNSDVTINKEVIVSGNVNLILCDGKTLTVNGGYGIKDDYEMQIANNLTIYGQTGGTGTLNATGNSYNGIYLHGNIIINGGCVNAKGAISGSFGIYPYSSYAGIGNITINGGTVTASGGYNGINVLEEEGGKITINGGTVITIGNNYGGISGPITFGSGATVMAGNDENSATKISDLDNWEQKERWVKIEFTEESSGYNVTITPGSNMTKTAGSGDAEQTGLTCAMTDVVYTANEGYYFPENYSVTAVNGISVTRNSYTQITVSGTPTADATITLTAPTAKEASVVTKAPEAKTLTYNGQAQELVTTGTATGGAMQYALGNATEATQPYTTSIPTATNAGTYYVWYKAVGDANHVDSDPGVIEVTISEKTIDPSETVPEISISDLSEATEGTAYNQTLTASGAQPITWAITDGALPEGLSLEADTGILSGTPSSTGTSTFTVTATNSYGSDSKVMSITVNAGSTIIDKEGSAPDDEKTSVENDPTEIRAIVSGVDSVDDSDTVRLILNTDSKEEDSLSDEEKNAAEAIKAKAEEGGLTIGSFVDITLFYEITDANGAQKSREQLSETSAPLTVKFPIPSGLQKSGRLFSIFRYHGSVAELLGQGSGNSVNIQTDKFSLYAIAYEDGAATEETEESEKKVVKPHTHTYAWDKVEATESQDGELRYQCTECYDILVRVPLSAYYVFNANTVDKINKAKQGETVKITTDRWISFHKMVFDALAARPDVCLEVSFLDGEYKGNRVSFTIPAGADNSDLFTENNFAGFMYLGNKYGLTTEEN